MKSLSFLIFASVLVAGCTDAPLIKSSDPAMIEQQQPRAASDTTKAIDPLAFRERTIKCDPVKRSVDSCYEEADLICTNERLFVSTIFKKVESDIPFIIFKCNTTITYEREDFLAKEKERTSSKPKRRSLMEDLLGVPTSR